MIELKLDNVSPDGDGHVAYLQIIDTDTGKVLDSKCAKYEEGKFEMAAKKYLDLFILKHTPKENIKNEIQSKIDKINKGDIK